MQVVRPAYSSIAELAACAGTSVPCAGNLPVKLDDPDSVWFIDRGAVNLFLVEFKDGVEQAAPQHLLRREAGWLVPGVAPDEQRRRRRHDAQPDCQGIARHPTQTPAGIPCCRRFIRQSWRNRPIPG